MMFLRVVIPQHERGFLYLDGAFDRMLFPGSHLVFTGLRVPDVKRVSLTGRILLADVEFLVLDPRVAPYVDTYRVRDTERGLVFREGNFAGFLTAGFHAYLKSPVPRTVEIVDASDPLIAHKLEHVFNRFESWANFVQVVDVADGHRGQLYYDNVRDRLLDPGRYLFWTGIKQVRVAPVDMRECALEIQGQELMTQDKVSLRLNLTLRFQVTDAPLALASQVSFRDALYREAQLALRDEVGARSLDDLLARKEDLGVAVAGRIKQVGAGMGVAVLGAGLRDIVLPGEMRTILNQVIEAEKRAQANMIARREETAATRNLMNTAKLLENNPVLMRLKELESTERIAEKIGSLSVVGGLDGLFDALQRVARPVNGSKD